MGQFYRAREVFENLVLWVLSIFLLVTIIPLLFICLIIPLLVIRLFAVQTSKLNPTLGKPLSVTSCHTAVDDIYYKPRATLVTVFYLKNRLDVDRLLERVAKLLESNKYPELKQTLSRWVCTYFWKQCSSFSICNHVIFDPTSDPEQFRHRLESLVTKPFIEGQPLWEVVAFPHYKNSESESSSALVIRVHHCLADGFALLSLIKSIADPNPEETPKRVSFEAKNDWKTKLACGLRLLFVTPVQTIFTLLQGFDYNEWTIPTKQHTGTLIQYESYNELEQDVIKQSARLHGKSVSAIIFSGFTAAVRNTMMLRHGKDKVPQKVTVLYPLPRLQHPGSLTNHLICAPIPAPVSITSSDARLNLISQNFGLLHKSALAQGMLAVNLAVGLISGFFKKEVKVGHFGTAILSNFLYSSKPFKFFDSEATHVNILTGLQCSRVALMCNAVSYNGHLVIGVKADSSLFPNKESVELFVKYMVDEFHLLKTSELNV